MMACAICVPAERAADCTADRNGDFTGDMRWRLPTRLGAEEIADQPGKRVDEPARGPPAPSSALCPPAALILQHLEGRDAIDRRVVFAKQRAFRDQRLAFILRDGPTRAEGGAISARATISGVPVGAEHRDQRLADAKLL